MYRESSTPTLLNAAALIEEVLQTYSTRAQNHNAALQLEVEEGAQVFAVPGEFCQVLSNFLINALDALPAGGGRIRIRANSARDWSNPNRQGLRLTIADTGCGINPSDMSKIFEPFYTTKVEVGTGLVCGC